MKKHEKCLTAKELKFITNYEWKTSNFYVNPKISKCKEIKERMQKNNSNYLKMPPPESLKGRPIISGPMSPTKHLSKLIGKILAPLVPLQESYIKDDWSFIKQLPRELKYEAILFTCDIVSLYTSIPHDLGIDAIDYWIQHHRDKIPERFTRDFIINGVRSIMIWDTTGVTCLIMSGNISMIAVFIKDQNQNQNQNQRTNAKEQLKLSQNATT